MNQRCENRVSAKPARADRAREGRGALRSSTAPGVVSALLLAALSVSPAALGQGQAGAAAPDAGATAHGQPSSAAKSQASNSSSSSGTSSTSTSQGAASSSAEPQMQDQSAPAAESLGEAARRARAQKTKSAAGAPKVYTDDKLSQLSGHGVSVVGDGNSGGASSGEESSFTSPGANPGGNSAASGGKNDEQYWRGRARAIHDQMAQCDQEISKLQDEIAKYGAVSVDPQSGAMQSIIYVNDRNAKIKQIEERKAGLQGQLDALEDEGRKAGADSGWFR